MILLGISLVTLVALPLTLIALARRSVPAPAPTTLRELAAAIVLYVIAFNLTFFVQELFLVLPKAMTPGLEATLLHNNHRWTGEHPIAALFQGTGVLATLLLGTVAYAVAGRAKRGRGIAFFLAFCGWFMALPQFVIGALSPGSDVGMAYGYLGFSPVVKMICALVAVALVPWLAALLARHAPGTRIAIAAAPFGAVIPIIAYRVPRDWIEVVLLPIIVALVGVPWLHAMARRANADAPPLRGSWPAFAAAIALLLLFQFVLRPGITFG